MNTPISTILLVEDNPDDEALTLRALHNSELGVKVVVARDGVEAVQRHRDADPDDRRPHPHRLTDLHPMTTHHNTGGPMAAKGQSSVHLAEARRLLDELKGEAGDPQTKATAAAAHATLVLAEQIAGLRLVTAAQAAAGASQDA
jgi:hypothetical protein